MFLLVLLLCFNIVAGQTDVDDIMFTETREKMLDVLQVCTALRERNNVLLESWNASMSLAEIPSTPKVTHTDLHVVQRDEHGFDNRCVLR